MVFNAVPRACERSGGCLQRVPQNAQHEPEVFFGAFIKFVHPKNTENFHQPAAFAVPPSVGVTFTESKRTTAKHSAEKSRVAYDQVTSHARCRIAEPVPLVPGNADFQIPAFNMFADPEKERFCPGCRRRAAIHSWSALQIQRRGIPEIGIDCHRQNSTPGDHICSSKARESVPRQVEGR